MADLSGTGTAQRPHIADLRQFITAWNVGTTPATVADGDTYTPSFPQTLEAATFEPTVSGITHGVTIVGKTVTFHLSAPTPGTLIMWGK